MPRYPERVAGHFHAICQRRKLLLGQEELHAPGVHLKDGGTPRSVEHQAP